MTGHLQVFYKGRLIFQHDTKLTLNVGTCFWMLPDPQVLLKVVQVLVVMMTTMRKEPVPVMVRTAMAMRGSVIFRGFQEVVDFLVIDFNVTGIMQINIANKYSN